MGQYAARTMLASFCDSAMNDWEYGQAAYRLAVATAPFNSQKKRITNGTHAETSWTGQSSHNQKWTLAQ